MRKETNYIVFLEIVFVFFKCLRMFIFKTFAAVVHMTTFRRSSKVNLFDIFYYRDFIFFHFCLSKIVNECQWWIIRIFNTIETHFFYNLWISLIPFMESYPLDVRFLFLLAVSTMRSPEFFLPILCNHIILLFERMMKRHNDLCILTSHF